TVDNDEIIFTYRDDNSIYEYIPNIINSSNNKTYTPNELIQKSIFEEKQTLIENCLFGVDIEEKSVQIARLRLWIELLKNAYYKYENEKIQNFEPLQEISKNDTIHNPYPIHPQLETLPNIDINIKTGNSLISRYSVDDKLQKVFNVKGNIYDIHSFRDAVQTYKSTSDKTEKRKMRDLIEKIKASIHRELILAHPKQKELKRLEAELYNLGQEHIFGRTEAEENAWRQKINETNEKIEALKKEIALEEANPIYRNALEWRYEFPEVLYDDGVFFGFDIVIGNPPYIPLSRANNRHLKYADLYKNMGYQTFDRTGDIYCLFYERGIQILKNNGMLAYITSNKWMRAGYGKSLRHFFTQWDPQILIDLGPGVFENVTVDTNILFLRKSHNNSNFHLRAVTYSDKTKSIAEALKNDSVILSNLTEDAWFIGNEAEQNLKKKIERIGKPLMDWDVKIYRGVLTGLNEAFIIDTAKRDEILANCKDEAERARTEQIIKPILRGRDIKRYSYNWAGLWVIFIRAGWTNENMAISNLQSKLSGEEFINNMFQSLMNYLKKYEAKAKLRDDQGDYWWELRPCAYYSEFEKEKIIYSEIVRAPQFHYDKEKFFIEATSFLMTGKEIKYICGLLNSLPVTFFFKKYYAGGGLGEEGYRYKKAFLQQ
ncbi:MAG TPA: TaqI-like C-terminal specificity domain-containing protein, partial [Candidatus Kapabacteria bacterium]|nr:TaqI-like C-terminal specificity domain-containing protein [Candidatus Kapabacteria bacterium]